MIRTQWLLLAVLLGCSSAAEPEVDDQSQDGGASPVTAAAPVAGSLDDLAPGDTLGILNLMRATMSDGNAIASGLERRDTVMPSEGYREARTLSVWQSGALPVKLVATEPNDDGLMRLETITWFVAGDISVIQEPFAVLMFDADRLVLWSDEAMEPVAAPEADRMLKERSTVDSVKARLKVFGIGYP